MSIITDGIAPVDEFGKLDTGMKAEEAIVRAENWWEEKGKRLVKNAIFNGKGFVSQDEDSENQIPSGIVNGLDWNYLTKTEQLKVVKVWHHFTIRRPDNLNKAPEDQFLIGKKGEL